MTSSSNQTSDSVRERLLKAALNCFLEDDYHKVTTRAIADEANTNISMIRYYFGNKEGLYEEMIKDTLGSILDVLDEKLTATPDEFGKFLTHYYNTMIAKPEFPKLILKVLALNQGPGRRFILQLLERGRSRGSKQVENMKTTGALNSTVDSDIVRMAFVSLAMTPMLLKDIFEEQMQYKMDSEFINKLASFNATLFSVGLASFAVSGKD